MGIILIVEWPPYVSPEFMQKDFHKNTFEIPIWKHINKLATSRRHFARQLNVTVFFLFSKEFNSLMPS